MAASGLVLVGFVIAHLLGNLLIYQGPDALNAYAHKLRELGWLLWAARASLLVVLVVHVWTSLVLAHENRMARPQRYAVQQPVVTTIAARTMMASGVLAVVFVIYHLLHFTFRVTHPELSHATDALGRHDVYTMVVLSFRQWPISAVYIIAMVLLCAHLAHGIASSCQTLGLNSERTIPVVTLLGRLIAVTIFLGYSSIPVAALLDPILFWP